MTTTATASRSPRGWPALVRDGRVERRAVDRVDEAVVVVVAGVDAIAVLRRAIKAVARDTAGDDPDRHELVALIDKARHLRGTPTTVAR